MIEDQNTIPMSRQKDTRPTFRQLRERYRLSYFEIAQQARVHVRAVYWMELGYPTEFPLALRILNVLSGRAERIIRLEEMQGVRVNMSFIV